MKQFLAIIICSVIGACCYVRAQSIAPVMMRLTNGTVFTNTNIKAGRPIALIYFSPDCEHCEALAKSISTKASALGKIEIIMVTYQPMAPVVDFDRKYKLSRFSNIYIGSEGLRFAVKNYYNVQHFPFLALYNSKGALTKTFPQNENPDFLVKQILALK